MWTNYTRVICAWLHPSRASLAHMSLANLLAEIELQGGYEGVGPEPVVSLEQFFEDNVDLGSIGGNLHPHPGIATFYRVLRDIRDRPEVDDVLVGISEVVENREW